MSAEWKILVVSLWSVVVVQLILMVVLFRQVGIVYLGNSSDRSRGGLPLNAEAPAWQAADHRNRTVSSDDFNERPLLLVFADPDCGPCQRLMPELQNVIESNGEVPAVVVGSENAKVNAGMAERYRLEAPILTQEQRELTDLFKVAVTPFAFVIDSAGRIREKGIVNSREQIEGKLAALGKERVVREESGV